MSSQRSQANTNDLWQKAISSIDADILAGLDPAQTDRRDVVQAVLDVAEQKRQVMLKKRWYMRKASGEKVIIRNILEKTIHWIRRFREVGDVAVQYDPGHAALPWAAVRFLLEAAIGETERNLEVLEGTELVSRVLAALREIETLRPTTAADVQKLLEEALVRAYVQVLSFLSYAISWYSKPTAIRIVRATFAEAVGRYRTSILQAEQEVLKYQSLVDSQRLILLDDHMQRIADLSGSQQQSLQAEKSRDLLSWLSPVPYIHHHKLLKEQRVSGTGEWLVQHTQFNSWYAESTSSSLLVHGIQGCGKTVLASAIIDHFLQDVATTHRTLPVAYFYCSASTVEPERRATEGVMRSLVRQLLTTTSPSPTVHDSLSAVYEERTKARLVDGFDVVQLTSSECKTFITEALEHNPATIIIDAVDELDDPKILLDAVSDIVSNASNIVKFILTSRDNSRVQSLTTGLQRIRITRAENGQDMRTYAQSVVKQAILDHKILLGTVDSQLEHLIVQKLLDGAKEMFLWIKLQLDRLYEVTCREDLVKALQHLETVTLQELYGAAFDRIRKSGSASFDIATHTFSWLLYSFEPLQPSTLLSLLTAGTPRKLHLEEVIHICQSLLHHDGESNVVRFTHISVQEFLQTQPQFSAPKAHERLVLSSLSVLSMEKRSDDGKLEPAQSMYDYAALYWGMHGAQALSTSPSQTTLSELKDFMDWQGTTSVAFTRWSATVGHCYPLMPFTHSMKLVMNCLKATGNELLFAISVLQLGALLTYTTWTINIEPNARNDMGNTALYMSCYFGDQHMVKYLLDQGADWKVQCGKHGSAMHCAAYRGHEGIVQLLLTHGASTSFGSVWPTAFHAACAGLKERVAMLLIDHLDRDETSVNEAFFAAAYAGLGTVITRLKEQLGGRVLNSSQETSLLRRAIASGRLQDMRYLLSQSLSEQNVPSNAVAICAEHDREEMAIWFIERGYDIEEPGDLGTPLRTACALNRLSMCRLLISHGALPDSNITFGSPLHAAARHGHAKIVQLLLDAGARSSIESGDEESPLRAAALCGHTQVVDILLGSAAENCRQAHWLAALDTALRARHEGMIDHLVLSSRQESRFASNSLYGPGSELDYGACGD